MNNIKQRILLIIISMFLCGIQHTSATEFGVNILNDSSEQLSGYTLKLQVEGEAKPITQTIDVSSIPPHKSQYVPLPSNFINKLPGKEMGKNEACISLCDPQGKSMTECLILDWKLFNHFPTLLKIKIDAHKKLASVESQSDLFSMALLAAPAA